MDLTPDGPLGERDKDKNTYYITYRDRGYHASLAYCVHHF